MSNRKTFPNPWHDPDSPYSPARFTVQADPLDGWPGVYTDLYRVLDKGQQPSVLVVRTIDREVLYQAVSARGAWMLVIRDDVEVMS